MSGKGSRTDIFKIISWEDFFSLEDTSTAATPGPGPLSGQLECCSHCSPCSQGWDQPCPRPLMALQTDICDSLSLINIESLSSQEAPGGWERGEEFQ